MTQHRDPSPALDVATLDRIARALNVRDATGDQMLSAIRSMVRDSGRPVTVATGPAAHYETPTITDHGTVDPTRCRTRVWGKQCELPVHPAHTMHRFTPPFDYTTPDGHTVKAQADFGAVTGHPGPWQPLQAVPEPTPAPEPGPLHLLLQAVTFAAYAVGIVAVDLAHFARQVARRGR